MSKSAAVPSLPKSKKLLPTSSKNSQNIYQWTNKLSSLSIPEYQNAFIAFGRARNAFFKVSVAFPTLNGKSSVTPSPSDSSNDPVLLRAGKKIKIRRS